MAAALSISNFQRILNSPFPGRLEFRQSNTPETLSTGVSEVDRLTTGGVPAATLTEIAGAPSSGRTSLLLSILTQSTAKGMFCAFIDGSDTFDPVSAMTAGVRLPQLLWVRCGGNAEHALKATDLLVQAGGFGLVVIDLGDIPDQQVRRISLTSWFRLRHAAEQNGIVLLAVMQRSNTASCSKLQLELRQERANWSRHRLSGLAIQAVTRKHYAQRSASFQIAF
jgi:recombination protein RecA